jgi:long-chain acyl-CoA synthetase
MRCPDIPFASFQKIPDLFLNAARTYTEYPFLRIRRKEGFATTTYQATVDAVRRIALTLRKNGLAPNERVAIAGENCPEWIFSYLGVLWAGGVVVPLDSRAKAAEWAHLMRHSECKFIFCSSEFYDAVEELRDTIPSLQEIIRFPGEGTGQTVPSVFETEEALPEPEPRSRADMAVILYTSGTTGTSKGVVLTHGNLLANLEQVLMALEINERDRFLSVLPIHHSFEATCGFLLPMMEGAMVTFVRSMKSKELLEDLRDTRPTVFLVVPLLLEKLHQGLMKNVKKAAPMRRGIFYGLKTLARACDSLLQGSASRAFFHRVRADMGLDALRYLISGGAALPRTLSREYENLGFPILQGYGLTETAPVLSVNLPWKCRNASTGLPLPGIELKIIDPNSEGIGEIAVKGSNVMIGYYKNEEATRQVLQEGWLRTGDLGKIDREGFLYVTGRKKSLIVTKGGKNISPEEIEEELLKSPFVKETVVLARIHPRTKNEEVHAIIYPDFEHMDEVALEKGRALDEKGIRKLIEPHVERVNAVLAEYKRIRSFSVREEEFPKTTTQKIKRYLFEAGGIEVK